MTFKIDSPYLGVLLGLIIPLLIYFLQKYLIPILIGYSFSNTSMQLFALVFNLPVLRYYLINLGFEKTGKGILFVTFIYAMMWVYFNKSFI